MSSAGELIEHVLIKAYAFDIRMIRSAGRCSTVFFCAHLKARSEKDDRA